jgi:hypothetical protein
MPPNRFRPLQLGSGEGAQEKQPGVGFSAATLPPTTKNAEVRLLALIEQKLGLVRCHDCRQQLSSLRACLAVAGPSASVSGQWASRDQPQSADAARVAGPHRPW